MSRFLFAVWPFAGHYFPTVAIAHALRGRGHQCAFYTGDGARPAIEAEGFQVFPFQSIDEARVNQLMLTRQVYASRRRPRQLQALLREWLLDTLPGQVTDLQAILDEWRPDVLVSETSMLGPMLVLHETQPVPVAVFSTVFACLLPGPDAPPFGMGLPRPHRLASRLLARGVQAASDRLAAGFRRAADDLRSRYGLPPLPVSVTAYTGRMPLYLVPGVPELDYNRRDLPPSVHYVGPCLWNRPGQEPEPDWLARLPGRDTPGRQPVIHVSEGTMHTRQPLLLSTAVRALAGMPAEVIMTTGGNRDPAEIDLGPLPPNFRLERWVSHRHLLPKTDLLITTGGAGTVMAALSNGVPLLIIPTDWDKPENAQRVADAGVGLRLPLPRCTPGRLRAAVDRLLADPGFGRRADQVSAILNRHDGPVRAAELLEGLAAGQGTPVAQPLAALPVIDGEL